MFRTLIGATILIALICGLPLARGQAGSDEQSAQSIRKREEGWIDAARSKDTKPLEEMLADDYTLTNPSGQVVGREEFLARIKDGTFKIESGEYSNLKVRVYGDAAVVTGRVAIKGMWAESDVSGVYAFTDTFIRHAGKWQQVAGQVTRMNE